MGHQQSEVVNTVLHISEGVSSVSTRFTHHFKKVQELYKTPRIAYKPELALQAQCRCRGVLNRIV